MICIYKTYSSNLDNVIKSEREDLTKKTEKFRQVNENFEFVCRLFVTCYIVFHVLCLQYILDLSKERMTFTLDRRITGSCIIDESLQVHIYRTIFIEEYSNYLLIFRFNVFVTTFRKFWIS